MTDAVATAPRAMETGPVFGVESSLTGRRWTARLTDERTALTLSQQLAVPDILGRVLAARGVTPETAERFLAPSLKTDLPDPSGFKDMDAAAERLTQAVLAGETIAVFGDYDVDGATASALLTRFLRAAGTEPKIYIPDRVEEGYGPSEAAFRELREAGVSVVVTVDCGTLAYEPLAAAKAMGLDVIVVDHHLAQPKLPECHALINPNRLDETGLYGHLAAVGVAFLLVVALNRALRAAGHYSEGRPEPNLTQWLDIVALGTVCDVVGLTGLNRTFVAQGLKVLAARCNPGLKALADAAGLDEAPSAYHLGFVLGPRINAGGRVGEADLGVRLLTTEDPGQAADIAGRLDRHNRERQAIEGVVLESAMAQAERGMGAGAPVVVAAGEGWHPGVIGIVAGRLKEHFRKPAIVIGLEDGIGKGSGRSIPGVDLGAAVTAASQAGLLMAGGGHPMAAGLTVDATRLDDLTEFLSSRLRDPVASSTEADRLGIDGALAPAAATVELTENIAAAGPFGAGNAEPRFAMAGMSVVKADIVGSDHVRAILAGPDGGRVKAVAFRSAGTPLGQALLSGRSRLHIAGTLKQNAWNGRVNVEMILQDAAIAE